jgi:hypothetical protein
MRKTLVGLVALAALAGCTSAAQTANDNLTKAADNFEVARRIVGINGITDKVLFSVEGFCSYDTGGDTIQAICKDTDGSVSRTTLGKANNVTFVVTQLGGKHVSLFHPRVIFAPERIVPNFDLQTSGGN